MEAVLHILGLCGDTHSHFDLLDLLMMGGSIPPVIYVIKSVIKQVIEYVSKF